jgi:hypothetical protein
MSNTFRIKVLPVLAVVALAAALAGLFFAVRAQGEDARPTPVAEMSAAKKLAAIEAQQKADEAAGIKSTHLFARAGGVDVTSAQKVYTTEGGGSISVARGDTLTCLLFSDGSDTCKSDEEIAQGWGTVINNECVEGQPRNVSAVGLVPSNVATVRLIFADKSTSSTEVRSRAFLFDGERAFVQPPDTIQWLDDSGAVVGEHTPPVKHLC